MGAEAMSIAHADFGRSPRRRRYGWLTWALLIWAVISAVLLLAISVGPAGGSLNVDWLQLRQQIVRQIRPPTPISPSRQVAEPAPARR
jgi:hypothetical protein